MSAWVDLASTERITAVGGVLVALYSARLASRVKALEKQADDNEVQREKDQTVIRSALRHLREWISYAALLGGLLQVHAPGVAIPPKPGLPDELKDEI